MDRRDFLKTLGVAAGSSLLGSAARADGSGGREFVGVLVDTTECIGCRSCEEACAEEHGLPIPDTDDESVFEEKRTPSITQYTVVNRFQPGEEEIFVKRQCFHCNQAACVSACLVNAMKKQLQGPVTWDASKCMGCRYCMLSCPFEVPKFEYHSPSPRIRKCTMCWERQQKGGKPACVEACPTDTLTFGTRRELLEEAKRRIYSAPDNYHHAIYGEHEAGGTGWLYLAAVPFEKLGFNTHVRKEPYPELTRGFLYAVPLVFILGPTFLLGVSNVTRRAREGGSSEGDDE
jgi:Fe-S-cluster-containing dehydrogenase component